ncbi:hypothetical protein WMF30_02845 [Sorangium sp. So ce134]
MSKLATDVDLLPIWTKRVAADLGGRDPLGLSRVAQMVADRLMPGIITQTDRARYYALYCWILWHIQQEERPNTDADFVDAFQRREAAVALATLLQDEESSPVGTRAATPRLQAAREQGRVAMAFRVLPASKLGGYGQYYTGCLYQLGLTWRPEGGFDQVTAAGEDLAQVIQATLSGTPYVTRRLFAEPSISFRDLEQAAERLSIDAISRPFARRERERLIQLFFELREVHDGTGAQSPRWQSLTHILAVMDAYERAGIQVRESALDEQLLYGPAYFGLLVSEDRKRAVAPCPRALLQCRSYWRQFCLHQYLTAALEWLLVAVLQIIEERGQGYPLDEVTFRLLGRDFAQYLEDALKGSSGTPGALMARLDAGAPPDGNPGQRARERRPYDHPLSEASLIKRKAESPAELAAWSCLLLAVLHDHWRGTADDPEYRAVMEHAGSTLVTANVLPLLDSWRAGDTTWRRSLHELLNTLVIMQHDRVMYEKGRLESCWIDREDDRLVHVQDYKPYLRPARHKQAVEILIDLGLLKRDAGVHDLTAAGREILTRALGAAA